MLEVYMGQFLGTGEILKYSVKYFAIPVKTYLLLK